ncbi:MAG: response regulator [Sphingobacteriales bacterium]|nr:MAG: response regulator [Sphingobacteriales bacterium]
MFEVGSISKLFTATLAAYAQANGQLSLTDPVEKYLPELQGSAFGKVLLMHLATHTAGGFPLQVPENVENEQQLMDYLKRRGKYSNPDNSPRPGVILLDLNMPKKDGRECLREIKSDDELKSIPVIVLTTSKAEEDILRTYDLGVNSFVTKPVTFMELVEVMKNLGSYWFDIVQLPKHNT